MFIQFQQNLSLSFEALRNWLRAQLYDCLIVGALWLYALHQLAVPGALLWAFVFGLMQFIPHFGPPLALLCPVLVMLFSGAPRMNYFSLLGVFAAIGALDALVLQPWLMRRKNRVPVWASILGPVVLGILIPFWGVVLAAPLLAVFWAVLGHRMGRPGAAQPGAEEQGGQRFSAEDEGVILPPDSPGKRRE
ncbi:MAG: AI-2E family transporter [Acidobacteriota bacterium]|nr:AI-2E family transporter [Acidobacteriota bacterium]